MRHDVVFSDETDAGKFHRIIWVTDLHLDAAGPEEQRVFFNLVKSHRPHLIFVGGDISNGQKSLGILQQLQQWAKRPLYYVLGNHDYYYGSIERIRQLAKEQQDKVTYLTDAGVVSLSEKTALIGHDGWSDGGVGDFLRSSVLLNDYFLIEELKDISPEERLRRLQALGQEAAANIKGRLEEALKEHDFVILLTHPPPFREACWYDGHLTDDNWAPHFVCRAMGEAVKPIMQKNPDKRLLVLSGHSHQGADVEILPNLRVLVGDSTLGAPIIQGIIHYS